MTRETADPTTDIVDEGNPLIRALYEAFADVPKAKLETVCHLGCCIGPAERTKLLATSLNYADPETLWYYTTDAIWTVGDELDFKYFTPRLLDLGLRSYSRDGHKQNFIAFPETFGKKLALAGFDAWTAAQRKSIDDAIYQIFVETVLADEQFELDGWLVALCYTSIPKARYLAVLDSEMGSAAGRSWRKSVKPRQPHTYKDGKWHPNRRISGAFWDELADEQIQELVDWIEACENRRKE